MRWSPAAVAGSAVAQRLSRDGATVAVTYARDETAANEVVARIRKAGGRAFALHAELGQHGDAASVWAAFDAHADQYTPGGAVDIIVNNAGIGRSSDLASLTGDGFDEVFAVNVRAPFFIVQHGLRRLRDGGRIINISSGAARLAMPEIIAYSATKGALDTFALNLAKELGRRRITVNSVAPGIVGDRPGNRRDGRFWAVSLPFGREYPAVNSRPKGLAGGGCGPRFTPRLAAPALPGWRCRRVPW